MPDTRTEFLEAMRQNPDDLETPLVFADWLEENGDTELAAFIRIQVQYEKRAKTEPWSQTHFKAHWDAEFEQVEKLNDRLFNGFMLTEDHFVFRHGLLREVRMPVQWMIEHGQSLVDCSPLLEKLIVNRVNGWGQRLAKCPWLTKFLEIEIRGWISPADAQAIAGCPHLGQLEVLEIWLGNQHGGDDEVLAAVAAGVATTYPKLRVLRIIDVPACRSETIAEANRLAGRDVAVAAIPAPRLYEISAGFGPNLFAGRFPDGTQVLADTLLRGTGLRLFLFDKNGTQTEVREINAPPECYPQENEHEGWEHTKRFEDYLIKEFDFEPTTIAIRQLNDPEYVYDRLEIDRDGLGIPTDPNSPPDEVDYADVLVGCLKHGNYIFNSSWFIEGGMIAST